jgi:hypothetical protein
VIKLLVFLNFFSPLLFYIHLVLFTTVSEDLFPSVADCIFTCVVLLSNMANITLDRYDILYDRDKSDAGDDF